MQNQIRSSVKNIEVAQDATSDNLALGKAKRKNNNDCSPTGAFPSIKKIKQRSGSSRIQTFVVDPELTWLTNNAYHTNVVLPVGGMDDARHTFQNILNKSNQSALYIHNPEALDDLKTNVEVEQGQLILVDGPFKKLLDAGGTLMLNVSNFSPQELDAFNTLMEENKWQGQTLKHPVRILCLIDKDTLKKNLLSGAQISRTAFQDMGDFPFEKYDRLPIHEPQDSYPEETQFIDMRHDPMWSRILLGDPSMNEDQQWEKTPGAFSNAADLHVLRNVPDDPYLMDELLKRKAENWKIRLETGLPEHDIAKRIANKHPASDINNIIKQADAPVCLINTSNFEEVLENHYGVISDCSRNHSPHLQYGKLTRHPSQLEQMRSHYSAQVSVLITDDLPDYLWDRLMQHPSAFNIAAMPGIVIPKRYITKLASINPLDQDTLESNSNDEVIEIQNEAATLFSQHVSFVHCIDPTLFLRKQLSDHASQETTLLHITPTMRSDALLYKLQREDNANSSDEDRSTVPSLQIKIHQLVTDLKCGKRVIVQGLEHNPHLTKELATLLHPPHYLYINGQRLHFGEGGGLTGKLAILTANDWLLDHHAFSPAHVDLIKKNNWQIKVCDVLHEQFPYLKLDVIRAQVKCFLTLRKIVDAQEFAAPQSPPIHYARLEMLFKQFGTADHVRNNLSASDQDNLISDEMFLSLVGREFLDEIFGYQLPSQTDPTLPRNMRAVLKDLLIGDYRQTGKAEDTRYDYLKICLRILFPKQLDLMPANSVDLARLQNLLLKVNHPNDIEQHGWRFLNAFSLDVIKSLVGEDVSKTCSKYVRDNICKKVVALTLDQANKQGLQLNSMLSYALHKLSEDSPVQYQLNTYQRFPHLRKDKSAQDKAELLLAQDNAVFLKGPPGTGKTHQVKQLTAGAAYTINIADEGTQEFDQILAAWAASAAPATLIIDEANLAAAENLAMLKSVFTDRTLYANGQVHKLSFGHRILFTGNADSMPGRTAQQVAVNSIPTLQFKNLKPDYLRKIFIEPIMQQAFGSSNVAIKEFCTKAVSSIHYHLQHAFPEYEFTPRDLEEFVAQTICFIFENKSVKEIIHRLPLWLGVLALNVYTNDISPEDKEVIITWFKQGLSLNGQNALPKLPHNIDLSETSIADTASTKDLANKISWWLSTQDRRQSFNPKNTTLGQQALLIEGPASRGKDTVVKAVLQSQKRPYIHINASPNNLDYLRQVLRDAYASGKVVLISELNLLPSGILEGELNALLTGHTNSPPQSGFALIATINPGDYAGRNQLSSALKNRMQKIIVADYQPEELSQIANFIASELSRKKIAGKISSHIAQEKVTQLIELHHGLIEQLQDQPSEFRPGIRQLRKALEQIQVQSQTKVSEIFDTIYAYYQVQANTLSVDASTKKIVLTEAQKTALKQQQLQRTLSLARPSWIAQPKIAPEISTNSPHLQFEGTSSHLRYDYTDHTIYFDDQQDAAILCQTLLRTINNMLHPPNISSSFTLTSVTDSIGNRTTMPHLGKSGVGQPKQIGNLGILLGSAARTYLPTSRENLKGEMLSIFGSTQGFSNSVNLSADPIIELNYVPTAKTKQGQTIVYLLAQDGTLPSMVQLDGQLAQNVFRDQYGAWFCLCKDNQTIINTLRYQLSRMPVSLQLKRINANFSGLDVSRNRLLDYKIQSIRRHNQGTSDIVQQLKQYFKDTFIYSDDDATALNATKNLTERSQRFIENGHGVCYEFASAFSAVLEQEFKIPARFCSGHVTKENNIPIERHRWVEYCDADGKWHKVDPTAAISNQSSSGTGNKKLSLSLSQLNVHLASPFTVPDNFSPNNLGLSHWEVQRKAASYNTTHGELDLNRLLRGDAAIYRDVNLGSNVRTKSIYITEFPHQENRQSWEIFQNSVMTPLATLMECGVTIYALCANHLGNKIWGEVEDLARMFLNAVRADETTMQGLDTSNSVILGAESNDFWDHLRSHYYESLLSSNNININDDDEVNDCLLQAINTGDHTDLFPLRVAAYGKEWNLTLDDFEHYLVECANNVAEDGYGALLIMLKNFGFFWQPQSKGIMQAEIERLIEKHAHEIEPIDMHNIIAIMFGEDMVDFSEFIELSVPILMTIIEKWLSAIEIENRFIPGSLATNILSRMLLIFNEDGFNSSDVVATAAMSVLKQTKSDSLEMNSHFLMENMQKIMLSHDTDVELLSHFKKLLRIALTPDSRIAFLQNCDL